MDSGRGSSRGGAAASDKGHGSSSAASTTEASKAKKQPRVCRKCGQHHSHHEPCLYNYVDEVDEDLMCQICLQPFVQPIDTPCGHTFCHVCMHNYLKVNPMCPLDRKPLNEMTCSPSNLVLKRLLDKLLVSCPNADSCQEQVQRGNLDDHLRYRCSGTLVACQFAASGGCDYRGPKKTMAKHQTECRFKKEGITRLPVLEGEVSHVEIPRTSPSLGITIVGGADTPLRCVVVQEVFPDGLIAQDGRLRPGDQIIEINGVDMTCANHLQVCAALRKMTSVLRLGVYRERIEKYSGGGSDRGRMSAEPQEPIQEANNRDHKHRKNEHEDMLTVTVERQAGKHLGIRLTGHLEQKPGIYIADIQEGSAISLDGRLQKYDRILFINGLDVRNVDLTQASALIQNNDKLSLVVGRRIKKHQNGHTNGVTNGTDEPDYHSSKNGTSTAFSAISHTRSRSEPAIQHSDLELSTVASDSDSSSDDDEDEISEPRNNHNRGQISIPMHRQQPQPQQPPTASEAARSSKKGRKGHQIYEAPEGEDYLAIYETIDRKTDQGSTYAGSKNKSHSMEDLETPTPSLKSFDISSDTEHRKKSNKHNRAGMDNRPVVTTPDVTDFSMSSFLKRALRMEGPTLTQRTTSIKKNVRESLGMRIGGGIGSNEGDTPIYVANIHPHGCIGKSKQLKKGDILLSVDGTSLCGLTHSQAVATLKATINLDQVVLGVMDGPETSFGASNFVPSWMYWQKIPRTLQYPKTVILHRKENASWGFSIVGGADPGSGRPMEPIHVLFVVPESPAAKDGKLKCGDRLLAVDGQTLENIPHHVAVSMLKRTSTRVVTEVVSWMGTEL